MNQQLILTTLLVRDYDEAIAFYTQKLHFILESDQVLNDTKRWVVVRPRGTGHGALLLAKASTEHQQQFIGNQSGGRVFLFLSTDDFERDYQNLLKHKITIVREPVDAPYGRVAVFEDLYGNRWDLIQPKN